jgi:hypothetical protein
MAARPGRPRRWWGRLALIADDDRDKDPLPQVALIGLVVALVGIGLVLWITF